MDGAGFVTVLHVAPPYFRVPPVGYGGIERAVFELVRAQHNRCAAVGPTVVAAAGSSIPGVTVHSPTPSLAEAGAIGDAAAEKAVIEEWAAAIHRLADTADVVHLHGTTFIDACADLKVPVVLSVYCDTSNGGETELIRRAPKDWAVVANSNSTKAKDRSLPWRRVIREGIDVGAYPFNDVKGDRLVFVGEMTAAKGVDTAVEVAQATGRGLDLIGRSVRPEQATTEQQAQREFLERAVLPHVDGVQVRMLGEMGEERLPYMADAAALLTPIRWSEPFGRAPVEAMACGTPVIGFGRGAIPEVVAHGESGYVVDSVEEMIAAVSKLDDLQPAKCRQHVIDHFSLDRVLSEYAGLYRSLHVALLAEPERSGVASAAYDAALAT